MAATAEGGGSSSSACPMAASRKAPPTSGCPFSGGSSASTSREAVDPRNMMPSLPQSPAAGQDVTLSKDRATSTIPKTGTDENWQYPSPQQFYHALLRRNKTAEADAMEAVVHTHNVTNEISWRKIMEWEQLHARSCATPSLLRFVGRPDKLSAGAWWSSRFSYRGAPFDRHDWYVDRCGQRTVRYVIDYYDDPRAGNQEEITVEARPACDSFVDVLERLRRPKWQVSRVWAALFGSTAS
mmetsp:Transcript_3292/g.5425  ORF Transcript_3292/g.5425 Transcript_3292/m.5425 type:complete len:240 (+) Transcript_3292:48-767(+)